MRRWRPWPYISIMPCSRRLAWHESISQIFVFFLLEFSIKFYPSTSIIQFFVCCYVNQPPIFCTIYSFFTFFSTQEPEKCRIAPSALPSIRSPRMVLRIGSFPVSKERPMFPDRASTSGSSGIHFPGAKNSAAPFKPPSAASRSPRRRY